MGLDMYLYRLHPGQTPDDVNAYLDDGFEAADYTTPDWVERWEAHKRGVEVAYWRKANEIHAWFVDNFQDGVDECEPSKPIGREQLAGLVERCKRIIADPALGPSLLPTRAGFFFGGTDYDEYYIRSLKETVEMLEPLLSERNLDTFFYQSSW